MRGSAGEDSRRKGLGKEMGLANFDWDGGEGSGRCVVSLLGFLERCLVQRSDISSLKGYCGWAGGWEGGSAEG